MSNQTISRQLKKAGIHSGFELGVVTEGSGKQYFDGRYYDIAKGDIFFLDAGVPHGIDTGKNGHLGTIVIEARIESVAAIAPRRDDIRLLHPFIAGRAGRIEPVIRDNAGIGRLLVKAWNAYRQETPYAKLTSWGLCASAFIALARTVDSISHGKTSRILPIEETITGQALNFLHEHFTENFPVRQLAAACGLSVSRFTHIFSRLMGIPPVGYRNRLRIEYALSLLCGSKRKIDDIAFACGFSALSQFHVLFRKITGMSPAAMRNSGQQHNREQP